ncbi:4175_t:CDS:2, partial [Gigaspora margarita]
MDFNGDNNVVAAQLQYNHNNGANSEDLATRVNNMSLENQENQDQPPPYYYSQMSTNNNQGLPQNFASDINNAIPQNAFQHNFQSNNNNGLPQNLAYNNNNNGIPFNNNNGIPFNNNNGIPFNNNNGIPFNNNNGIPFNNNNGIPFNNNNGIPFNNNNCNQQQNFIPMQFQQQAANNQLNNYEIPSEKVIKSSKSRPNLRNQKSGVFKILLLGGTGTGKSTIINTVTNYFLGGTLDNPKIVIPTKYYHVTEDEYSNKHTEAKVDDVTKSQTTKCSTYTFKHPDNPSSKFIFYDTPGLSDTKGIKQDDENIQEIINTAIAIGSLSAIVIIASGTEARVTPTIRNTLVRLGNNLPDELMANLLLILTKCNKGGACFSIDAFTKEIAKPK